MRNDIYSSTKGMNHPAIPRGAGRRYCALERSHLANVRIRGSGARSTQRPTTWAAYGMFLWASTLSRSWCASSRNTRCNRTSGENRGPCLPVCGQNSVSYGKISTGSGALIIILIHPYNSIYASPVSKTRGGAIFFCKNLMEKFFIKPWLNNFEYFYINVKNSFSE